MKPNAILFTGGILDQPNAKTAHGLIRETSRYTIVAVIDQNFAGQDAGTVLDGRYRDLPVYATLADFLRLDTRKAAYAIIGVAPPGGKLPAELLGMIKGAIRAGISIVSGLHDFLSDKPELAELAGLHRVTLTDIRKPRPKETLKFWTGKILEVRCPVIAVLGTDCALGKRTTAGLLTAAVNQAGLKAQMIYTGQTGWLQGHAYGFVLDSTYNDFISGELENAVVMCEKETSPDVIIIEGQSALFNPSGPCGSELILSAGCKGVILQHAPARTYYNGYEHTGIRISIVNELAVIRLLGATVLAISLNTKGLSREQALEHRDRMEKVYRLPTILPLEEGVDRLVPIVQNYRQQYEDQGR